VEFLGFVEHKEMMKYFEKADIFIRPSLSEGLGTAFLEAMAAEVPVIATPVGGIPDFLKDGETGLFCEVNNPRSIAEKVKILLDNKELREKIIFNAKKLVEENYDWNSIAEKMKSILNQLNNL
jgi:glycosyltransferase involved in cell wall biosynthesis